MVSQQAAYIITDILAGNTDPKVNPFWGAFELIASNGTRRPATLKTGTNNDARDLNAYGFIAPPTTAERTAGQYALAAGAWNGNSDNSLVSTPKDPLFSIDVTTFVWQGFMEEATKAWKVDQFARPAGIVTAKVDAYSGMAPGPYTTKTVNELFIDGTQPKQPDNTKVGIQVEQETNTLWQDGCFGTPVTKGFLDLSNVESSMSSWQAADRAWAARAARGSGVLGGPGPIKTRTAYFYNGAFRPFGSTWGAPFPPSKTCSTVPPSPSPSGLPSGPPSFPPPAQPRRRPRILPLAA